ncbi:unnamed protein product [Meloidogyne enterolobii]|uniref:Uncharacterized protein n=1 Tax=Meloidogyne enterolobii TaxID=390850 RepID=A0ACB0XZ75_MELEN
MYGLGIEEAYKMALSFYRDQEKNRSIAVDYRHRLKFIALSKQAKYGTYKDDGIECGWFDLVGNDARKVWKTFSSLPVLQAMLEFIRLLDAVCPTFRNSLENQQQQKHKIEMTTKMANFGNDKNVGGEGGGNSINAYLTTNKGMLPDPLESKEILQQFEQQRQQIQEALNKQTYHQFLAYAQQTHPGEPEKQEHLISQLQEQHYQQYMSQVYAQAQAASQATSNGGLNSNFVSDLEAALPSKTTGKAAKNSPKPKIKSVNEVGEGEGRGGGDSEASDEDEEEEEDEEDFTNGEMPANPIVAPASVWTNKNLAEFKEAIKKEGPEGILKIGHGETVTVRVPTHPEGNSLFWEFCTDYYDIGFGVYFEWTVAETNQVTVHVDESGDEYEEDEAEASGGDVEKKGGGDVEAEAAKKAVDPNKPRIDEIIPTFRKDSHQEVFFGSHFYPGRGIYLLKFDNSYSLWRSKTLYYRVFYSK